MSSPAMIAYDAFPVTTSDTATFKAGCIKCITTGGAITVKTYAGTNRVLNIAAGETLPLLCIQLLTTGTVATGPFEVYIVS